MEESETTPRRLEAAASLVAEHLAELIGTTSRDYKYGTEKSDRDQIEAKGSFAAALVMFVDIAIAESKNVTTPTSTFVMQVTKIYSTGTEEVWQEHITNVHNSLEAAEELTKQYRNCMEYRYEFESLEEISE